MSKYKELKLCKNSSVWGLPFRKRYIFRNIRYIPRILKDISQRAKYGISESDSWDFCSYLPIVLENGLKFLKHAGNSHPAWCSYEDWQTKLLYLSKLCEIINLESDELTNETFDNYLKSEQEFGKDSEECKQARDKWLQAEVELDKLKDESMKKVLNELSKYINDLWD